MSAQVAGDKGENTLAECCRSADEADRYLIGIAEAPAPGYAAPALGQRDAIRTRLARRRQAVQLLCAVPRP